MSTKPIHPWTPGSVRSCRHRPGPRDASHGAGDQPKPLRELAEAHGVRWYRDACGDDTIPGRRGELFRLGGRRLGVQLGGPRANNTVTVVPKGSNARINALARRFGWPTSQRGDGEAIFAVTDAQLSDDLRAIGAYRRPRDPLPLPRCSPGGERTFGKSMTLGKRGKPGHRKGGSGGNRYQPHAGRELVDSRPVRRALEGRQGAKGNGHGARNRNRTEKPEDGLPKAVSPRKIFGQILNFW